MDVGKIESILHGIGAERVRVVGADKVSCACPLARWTHTKGHDSHPSFVVFAKGKHGDPIYACQACHEEGSLRDLLLFLWTKGRDTYYWIDVIDSDVPISDAVKHEHEARTRSEKLFLANEQFWISGFDVRKYEPPPPASVVEAVASDSRPFYDHTCLREAEAVEEIPWSEYEPYAAGVPRYALERGLTIETCKTWELGHDRRHKRLLFPIRDRGGRLVAISGRLYATSCVRCGGEWVSLCSECGNNEAWHESGECLVFEPGRKTCIKCGEPAPPKYFHRKGFKRNLLLYGEHRIEDETDGRVYVVEGHLDMMRMWQAGYRPVVALLGTGVGESQIEKIVAYWGDGGRVVVVPDGDKAGREMATKLKKMIAGRMPISAKALPEGTDPGSMSDDELRELLGEPPWPRLANLKALTK